MPNSGVMKKFLRNFVRCLCLFLTQTCNLERHSNVPRPLDLNVFQEYLLPIWMKHLNKIVAYLSEPLRESSSWRIKNACNEGNLEKNSRPVILEKREWDKNPVHYYLLLIIAIAKKSTRTSYLQNSQNIIWRFEWRRSSRN